jgi:glycine/D-amino acid oxidase-like deaminating enzyme
MKTVTSWEDIPRKEYGSFKGEMKADVVIVGGGMAGVFSAYLLSEAGKKVILLEKDRLGNGYTLCTTAFLTQSIDIDTPDLIKLFGKAGAQEILASHQTAIDLVEAIVKREKINCDFTRCSNYIYANSEKDLKALAEEAKALSDLGIKITLSEKGKDLGIPNAGYIEICNQAKFHPLKFLTALAACAEKNDAQIFEQTEAIKLEKMEKDRQKVITKNGSIEAEYVVVATYKPFNNPLSLYFKKGSYVSYVLEMEVRDMNLKEGTYEDTENPYHYFRVDPMKNYSRVIIGGEDHRQDIPVNEDKNYAALIEYADSLIPPSNRKITKQWDGIILEPVDGLATIGQIGEEHVLYALGFSGNGMSYSAIAALIFRDVITGSDNSLIRLYHPRRHIGVKKLATKAKDYTEELVKGAFKTALTQKKKPKK